MDQLQQDRSPENDLQKAIDSIASKTHNEVVFATPTAAPSTVPEDDNGEFSEPIGPFPMPEADPQVDVVTPGPEPMAPIEPLNLPPLEVSGEDPADATVVTKPDYTGPEPDAPIETPRVEITPPPAKPAPRPQPAPVPAPAPREVAAPSVRPRSSGSANVVRSAAPREIRRDVGRPQAQVIRQNANLGAKVSPEMSSATFELKKAILKDLTPLIEHTDAAPSQKFKIYRDTMESLHDYSVLDQAYQAASSIEDETERADSLLYLLESIDAM